MGQGVGKEKGGFWGQRVHQSWSRDEVFVSVFPQLCSLRMRVGHWRAKLPFPSPWEQCGIRWDNVDYLSLKASRALLHPGSKSQH